MAGGQRARAARRFPHPDLHSCGRGGKRLPGRQELQRGKWHIVLAPLDPACRLAEHPIESLEIVLNEIKVTGEITDF